MNTNESNHNEGILYVDTSRAEKYANAYFDERITQDDRDWCDSVTPICWTNQKADQILVRICNKAAGLKPDQKQFQYLARYKDTVITVLIDFTEDGGSLEDCYSITNIVERKLNNIIN
ncbi:MAG: hypothetical protein ACYCZF_06800 [Anaerolineae bacterium]